MSEIEKMYENAEIKPTKNWQSCLNCKLKTEKFRDEWGEEYLTCINFETPEKCSNAKKYYPLFTSEKQIELIKLLAKGEIKINNEDDEYEFSIFDTVSNFNSFEESLADLTNRMWQSLSKEEKQQVKGILE